MASLSQAATEAAADAATDAAGLLPFCCASARRPALSARSALSASSDSFAKADGRVVHATQAAELSPSASSLGSAPGCI